MQDVIAEVPDGESGRSRRAVVAAAAGGALAAFLAACGSSSDPQTADAGASDADAPIRGHDLEVVNFALLLEYVEVDFYDEVVDGGRLSGRAAEAAKEIRDNEHEHVDALEALARKIGSKQRVERPQTHFPLAGGPNAVLRLAARIEQLGATAYLGQLETIENRGVLAAAVSIHSIEARHSATLNRLLGWEFTPEGATASPRNMGEVLDALERYIV